MATPIPGGETEAETISPTASPVRATFQHMPIWFCCSLPSWPQNLRLVE